MELWMAEREGFEPSDPVRDHLISSQARSAAPAPLLRELSPNPTASFDGRPAVGGNDTIDTNRRSRARDRALLYGGYCPKSMPSSSLTGNLSAGRKVIAEAVFYLRRTEFAHFAQIRVKKPCRI